MTEKFTCYPKCIVYGNISFPYKSISCIELISIDKTHNLITIKLKCSTTMTGTISKDDHEKIWFNDTTHK